MRRSATDRFNSSEAAPEWDASAFKSGHAARMAGRPQKGAQYEYIVGDWAKKLWIAGWCDADQTLLDEVT